ncbi:MAG: hypothetical protein H0T79_07920, partial [Deltaproteobacteria bacterium]|nr:hypothetical protein [Deltaproteobacteria bacterium]
IGRGRNGELIVCVRDPVPQVVATLGQAVKTAIVIAVAPASQLELLVDQTYGTAPHDDDFDVDLSTGPIEILRTGDPLDLSTFTLVGLDDHRVSKDPTQSGQFAVPRTLTPLPAPPHPQRAPELDETLVKLQRATSRDLATDLAMEFAIGRWSSSLLLTIKEGMALGHRGHGAQLSEDAIVAVTVPLATPSIVRAAHDARRLVTEVPAKAGAIQERLTRLLGQPARQAAAPIVVGQRIACVMVVGDPRDASHATSDMTLDLDDLTVALGSAYARIIHDTKRT